MVILHLSKKQLGNMYGVCAPVFMFHHKEISIDIRNMITL